MEYITQLLSIPYMAMMKDVFLFLLLFSFRQVYFLTICVKLKSIHEWFNMNL